jgi:lipoprotein-releasing system permease protein
MKDVAIVCSVGFILSILATLYPAFRATQVEPAEVLRYE